jgi:hypothetical protein
MVKRPQVLPSVFQYAEMTLWEPNLHWVKIDFSQAYFNIPIARTHRKYLSFKVGTKTYRFKVLPFGLGIAPWICQTFLAAIVKWVKQFTKFVVGHIDDLLIGHSDPVKLTKIVDNLVSKLVKACWDPNWDKSILVPTPEVKFLNALWTQTGVKRLEKDSEKVRTMVSHYDPWVMY